MVTEFGHSIDIDLWKNPYSLNLGFIKAGHEIDPRHQTWFRMLLRKLTFGAEYAHHRWRTPAPPFLHRALKQGTENKRSLFQFLLDQTSNDFVVDSSKHYLGALNLYQAAPDQTRVILLLRDGRAVFNSGISRGMNPKSALNAWIRHCRRSSYVLKKHLPDSALLTVHYEALATSPMSELKRISEFLGINFHPQMLEFGNAESHIANGNRMRFVQSSEIKLDERWREQLSAPMLQFFEQRAGELNKQLGYDN
jgi:hypothetical protein